MLQGEWERTRKANEGAQKGSQGRGLEEQVGRGERGGEGLRKGYNVEGKMGGIK